MTTFEAKMVLSVVLVGSTWGVSAPPANPDQEAETSITVRVYNYAEVPPRLWTQAEFEAQRIMAKGRIHVAWIECPLRDEEARANPVCRGELGPTDFVLRLHSRFKPVRSGTNPFAIGFAPLSEGERGAYVALYYERVLMVAAGTEFSRGVVTACAVAHEFGHLLLRSPRHTPAGIMRGELGQEELKRASVGRLLFTPEQYERMRAEIRARRGD